MDMLKIKPVNVQKNNTFRNIGILRVKMKKLGLDSFEITDGWLHFGVASIFPDIEIDPSNEVGINIDSGIVNTVFDDEDLFEKMPAINEAIVDFCKAEGIVD